MNTVLGVDTSNYTTSLCAVSADDGRLLASARMILPVTKGQRGLRQSDALFFHVQQLPTVMADLMKQLHAETIQPRWTSVGVSVRPRPYAQSYMPVFQAGASFAMNFGQALGIPVVRTSHQEGHLAAAEYFTPMSRGPFVGVHISGGTSDVMLAERTHFGYRIALVGAGLDLHAGQFVDRIGVRLGLPFPAGPHLEKLADQFDGPEDFTIPSAVHGAAISFSGPLSAALRAIDSHVAPGEVASAVQRCIAVSVAKAVEHVVKSEAHTVKDVLVAGGVASNAFIRRHVTERLERRIRGAVVQFAPADFARDNALGVARIAFLRR
ncbi:Kae1-like domain-containing protein [Alicyclobacillus dauci]|uniref:N(6)-L-threonylcarbamoyladenine synthase n=1 Tax=Alicyclobacillus dauci TaxID=1475485 RepID=A0ABY6Z7W8_9BACL|nr:peptidase M22 [Alicyclobacillus dauci]WAH39008.1 peptidase M22 [Alicyclobacillus dauci]